MFAHRLISMNPDDTAQTIYYGIYTIQDVYPGPGLAGIARGTAKKLRVVGWRIASPAWATANPDQNPWMTWLKPRSRTGPLPPYHTGACKSKIMDCFEPAHYGVQVSENEKRTFACWLDLLIPFCGSYAQHNTWTDAEKAEYGYFQEKRRAYAAVELESWRRSRAIEPPRKEENRARTF